MNNYPAINHISECFIKPKYVVDDSNYSYYLTPWDLKFISMRYGHEGLVFKKPKQGHSTHQIIVDLKESLAITLVHFYPLTGQLVTKVDEEKHRSLIFVDCNKGPGAKFVHAKLDLPISDLLTPKYAPSFVNNLFLDNNGVINYDGHTNSLIMVQVTEFTDGLFLALSINHVVADGISFWHFLTCWSEIYGAKDYNSISVSRPPILKRWMVEGCRLDEFYIPYIHPDEFITRYSPCLRMVRYFNFPSTKLQKLKLKAIEENNHRFQISSYQALLAQAWRSIVRARRLPPNQITHFNSIPVNYRPRLDPPLPDEYFGNAMSNVTISASVRELTENGLGWVAQLLHTKLTNIKGDKEIRDLFRSWSKSPTIPKRTSLVDVGPKILVSVGGSPRSNLYNNEFGVLGKPIALRKGTMNKIDGQMYAHSGIEGTGSVELGIWLSPDSMAALESDHDFMSLVSSSTHCRL